MKAFRIIILIFSLACCGGCIGSHREKYQDEKYRATVECVENLCIAVIWVAVFGGLVRIVKNSK